MATVSVNANGIKAGEVLQVGDAFLINNTGAAVTAAQVVTVLTGGTVTNLVFQDSTGTTVTKPTGYGTGVASGNNVSYTATTTGPIADLTIGGTAQTGIPQVTQLAITTAAAATTINYTFNGTAVAATVLSSAGTGTATNQAAALAASINAYAGSTIATAAAGVITIVSPTAVSLAGFSATSLVTTYGLAPSVQTVAVGTAAAGATTFAFDGVTYTFTGTSSKITSADALAAKINSIVGYKIATADGVDTVTISSGQGHTIGNFSQGTYNQTTTTVSAGYTAASASGISVVQGQASTSGTDILDASKFVGSTKIASENSAGAVTVQNLTTQTAEISGNGGSANGNFRTEFKDTATAANLNVVAGVRSAAITVTGTNVATTTVNSVGATNSLAASTAAAGLTTVGANLVVNASSAIGFGSGVSNAALTSIVVSGAAQNITSTTGLSFNDKVAVDLGTLGDAVKTVDASALAAGGVYVALNNGIVTSFKGGQGNDVVVAGATTNTAASIDAGAGTGDKLIVGATNDIGTNGSKYLNFEVLQNDGTSALNASKVAGIGSVITKGAGGGFTNLTAAQAANVSIIATQDATAVTYSLTDASGTSDVLGVTVSSTDATSVLNATALTIGGFETLNLTVSTGGTAIYNADGTTKATTTYGNFANASSTDLKTVNIAGANAALYDISSNSTKVTALNASANTAGVNLKVGGQTGALVVTGSDANDLIQVAAKGTGGSQAINLGAGNDTVSGLWSVLSAVNSLSGGVGTDTLASTTTTEANVAVVDSLFSTVTGIEKFTFANTTKTLEWIVGGYANGLVTSTGGTLDISAKALAAAATINANGLTGSNLLKLDIKNAGNSGDTIITSSTGGADSITITTAAVGATGYTGNITADGSSNTSAGITINGSGIASSATGVISFSGGSGADTITLGTQGTATVTGGAGQDKITAGGGTDTIRYTTAATSVGDGGINVDTITSFTHGTDKIGLQGSSTAGYLLNGVTLTNGTSTVAAMLANVTDNTSVNSLADVYAAITANGYFGAGNFAATGTAAAGNQIIAKEIIFANGSAAGAYLVVNDAIAGFQGAKDLVIKIGATDISANDFSILA